MISLCNHDPVLDLLRASFPDANVLRRPQRKVKPLAVLAVRPATTLRSAEVRWVGDLLPLLIEPAAALPPVRTDPAPRFSGVRSCGLKHEAGIRLLGGFLEGLGVDPSVFHETFDGADTLRFDFRGVEEQRVDLARLGQSLAGMRLDTSNPTARLFLDPAPRALVVVDTTVTSSAFSVEVEGRADARFDLRAPLQAAVAEAGVKVEVSAVDGRTIHFAGKTPLTFAFTCVRLDLGPGGEIRRIEPAEPRMDFSAAEGPHFTLWPPEVAGSLESEG